MTDQAQELTARSADGTKIGFTKFGSGPSVVLVHGSVSTGEDWLPVATSMADRFTCYVMDRRGRGRSGDGPEYSLAREGEDIKAVLDCAGPGAHLVGHSYGAICSLEAASRFSVGRLALYEPPLLGGENPEELARLFRAAMERNQADQAMALFLERGPGLSGAEVAVLQTTPLWKRMVELAPTLPREMDAIRQLRFDLERYRSLSARTLLLVGTASPPHLKTASSGLQDTLPDARTVLLDGQSHIANMLAPDLVAREISEFLLG